MCVLRAAQPLFPPPRPAARHRQGGCVRHRAAERRRRAGRHLPGDRQQRDDVRHAGLSRPIIRRPRPPGAAVRKLLVIEQDRAYCQPCLSPVWDTGLAGHALAEAGCRAPMRACAWLQPRQITDVVGDWAVRRPGPAARRLGVPVRQSALSRRRRHRRGRHAAAPQRRSGATRRRSTRAREWIIGMQSSDGGWGAFEPENTHLYLNHIPFADHGALLDPPTADVTARCVSFLAQIGMPRGRSGAGACAGVPAARAGGGRQLVRPLGHELHLRHVVGAVRAQRGRCRAGRSGGAARGRRGCCRCSGTTAAGARTRKATAMRRTAATTRARRARRRGRCSA